MEGSDSDESEFEREPAPWDRPEYGGGGASGNPWESDREETAAPWESRCGGVYGMCGWMWMGCGWDVFRNVDRMWTGCVTGCWGALGMVVGKETWICMDVPCCVWMWVAHGCTAFIQMNITLHLHTHTCTYTNTHKQTHVYLYTHRPPWERKAPAWERASTQATSDDDERGNPWDTVSVCGGCGCGCVMTRVVCGCV